MSSAPQPPHPPSARPGPPRTLFGRKVPEPVLAGGRRLTDGWGLATYRLRPLPEFLVIGAKRSGTTSLYFQLLQHPGILPLYPSAKLLPKARDTKGVHYFDTQYDRGDAWYRSHFPSVLKRSIAATRLGYEPQAGEASPYCLYHPLAPQRAAATDPSARLVAILRNPVERTYSHYREQRRNGVEQLSFAEAIDAELERTAGEHDRLLADEHAVSFPHEQQSYVAQSEYVHGFNRWLALFDRRRLAVVASERFYQDPSGVADSIYSFLGLPELGHRPERVLNAAPKDTMDPGIRRMLTDHFAPLNRQLEAVLDQRFGWDD